MDKKRILFCSEFCMLNTGFASYYRELIKRLYETGKYEIADFATYYQPGNPIGNQLPWRLYGNMPCNDQENAEYNSKHTNQFGEWRFNWAVLDFKPDVIIGIRDPWMLEHEYNSELRDCYKIIHMPTVDSAPQHPSWLAMFADADKILTYSDFGKETLDNNWFNTIKTCGVAPGGVQSALKPNPNRIALREKYGISQDSLIFGTVMRNQKRKLFPDLMQAFRLFLDKNPDIAHKCYLYLHTGIPDVGWNIIHLIKEHHLSRNILVSYICDNCKKWFPAHFRDVRCDCPFCGGLTAHLPNTGNGLKEEQLCEVYNLMDVYIQYSICEGLGIPQIEAATCGIPIMAVNYSAMESVIKDVKGTPINVERMFLESETHAYRAYPDNNDLVEKLTKFARLPKSLQQKRGFDSYLGIKQKYTWEKTAKTWMDAIDSLPTENKWNNPPRIFEPKLDNIPWEISPSDFLSWCYINILGQPEKINNYMYLKLLRDLSYGLTVGMYGGLSINEESVFSGQMKFQNFQKNNLVDILVARRKMLNEWEMIRVNYDKIQKPLFIQMVKPDIKDVKP
jgi:glycosyltransferase involved in cell wall biosynthesis